MQIRNYIYRRTGEIGNMIHRRFNAINASPKANYKFLCLDSTHKVYADFVISVGNEIYGRDIGFKYERDDMFQALMDVIDIYYYKDIEEFHKSFCEK